MTANLQHIQQKLLASILDADREIAAKIIDEWAEMSNYSEAMSKIVEPVLDKIGNMWLKEETTLAQTYVAGKIAEDVLLKAAESNEHQADSAKSKGPVVMGNIEDDYHSLGRRLVVTFLRASGWTVYDLGNDVSANEFVDKVMDVNSRVLGVSAMMYITASNIKKLRQEIDKRGLTGKVQLAVGGAVFKLRPQLMNEVGGDGTTNSAINAPKLFNHLWQKSVECEAKYE